MSELPLFLREALEDDVPPAEDALPLPGEVLETLADFSDLLMPDPAALALWARLERSVERAPLRYAPFFDQLGDLFGLDDAGVSGELERSLDPGGWTRTPFTGVRLFRVNVGVGARGHEAFLVRLAKKARIPRHRHPGQETTFVLEGGYREDSGREFHAGDSTRESSADSYHSLEVIGDETCLIALGLEKRFVFESWFYRAILNTFWR